MTAFELLLLEQLPDVGPVTVRRLVEHFGSAGAALRASDAAFAGVGGREAAAARRDPELRSEVRRVLERAATAGTTVLTWADDGYPDRLHHLADPPPILFLRGRTDLLAARPMVTVVGARRSTARAREVAERLGAALARAGVCVTSGLALGVDGSAHAGALRAGGDTVAVLGAGLDVPYPRFHRRLHETIAERGLLVSEFVPGTRAAPHHFPRRNRILAALAGITVVVEAGARSGSLITVDHALDLGKEVWAVPGPIDAPTCRGSNRLLVDGARPLVSIDDFVDLVAGGARAGTTTSTATAATSEAGGEGSAAAAPTSEAGPTGAHRPAQGRDDGQMGLFPDAPATSSLERRILEALRDGAVGADELAHRLDVPVGTVLAVLTTLELHGEVERLAGMRFRRAA